MKTISPTSDLAFQKIFASEENKDILAGLTKDFFSFEPEEIIIKNPYSIELVKELLESSTNRYRLTIKDVAASFKTSEFISDMQIRKRKFFEERFLYYPFKGYL